MSSSAPATAPPQPAPQAPIAAPSRPPAPAGTTQGVAANVDLPTRLASLRILAAAVVLVVAFGLAAQLYDTWAGTRQAQSDTEQLLRVQGLKVDLLRTDALATNAFLIGGLEPASQRTAYDTALSEVSGAIADAARAQPADRAVLGALNESVVNYAELMEQARANNRQGFPVGAAYLGQADTELRSTAIPLVEALVTANKDRSEDSIGSTHTPLLLATGLVGLGFLWFANRWLAMRFRRRFNVGLALAAAGLTALTAAAALLSANQASNNSSLLDGTYRSAVTGADARSAANLAKADESLRLIQRGSGDAVEKKWVASAEAVDVGLATHPGTSLKTAWQAYTDGHAEVVAADSAGDWDAARNLAISTESQAPSTTFAAFDTALASSIDRAGRATVATLGSRLTLFLGLAILTILGGLVAAALAWRGVSARLKEFE